MEVTHGRGYVYSIQYHIVWCVKYRHKIITEQIENRLIEILNKIADDNGFQILECNTDKDHIHLLVNCSPQHYIPDMIKALKGVSARLLMKEFGEELKRRLYSIISIEMIFGGVIFCVNVFCLIYLVDLVYIVDFI